MSSKILEVCTGKPEETFKAGDGITSSKILEASAGKPKETFKAGESSAFSTKDADGCGDNVGEPKKHCFKI